MKGLGHYIAHDELTKRQSVPSKMNVAAPPWSMVREPVPVGKTTFEPEFMVKEFAAPEVLRTVRDWLRRAPVTFICGLLLRVTPAARFTFRIGRALDKMDEATTD